MSLRQTKALQSINYIQNFTKIACDFLSCQNMEDLLKVKETGNQVIQTVKKAIQTSKHPLNETLISISNFFLMLYRTKGHLLGQILTDDELKQLNGVIDELNGLMGKQYSEFKDLEYGDIRYLVNSYLSLGAITAGCVLQDELQMSDDALLVRANTFISVCVYDQTIAETIANKPRTEIEFNYLELSKGLHVIDHDELPNTTSESLIYSLNQMIVEVLLKKRYRMRTSYNQLSILNSILARMNLGDFASVRAMLTEDQSRFVLSTDHLKVNQLQSNYVPSVCGLMGRIDSEQKAEALLAYILKSHQLILKLVLQADLERESHGFVNSRIVKLTQEMSTCLSIDIQVLCSHMNRYQHLSLPESTIRILERDLLLIVSDMANKVKELGADYDQHVFQSYRTNNSGFHAELRPSYVRLQYKQRNEPGAVRSMIAEITNLIKTYECWQEKDGSIEDKARFARMTKDYFYACLSSTHHKPDLHSLRELLYSFEIDKLKANDGCDSIYELLFLVSDSTLHDDEASVDIYLRRITAACQNLARASKIMSPINLSRFIACASRIIGIVLADKNHALGHLKQKAIVCSDQIREYRHELDEEVKAIMNGIESPKKKYNPSAAITSPQDTMVSINDYLNLAVRIMHAENAAQLHAFRSEIERMPAHPLILLDGDNANSQSLFNRSLMHLQDMLEIIYIVRQHTLHLALTPDAQTVIKEKINKILVTIRANHNNEHDPATRAMNFFYGIAGQLGCFILLKDSIEIAKNATDFIIALRRDVHRIFTLRWPSTKSYPAETINDIINSCQSFLNDINSGGCYGEFAACLKSHLVSTLSQARTRALRECANEMRAITRDATKKSSTNKYHRLFISVNLLDNVITRLGGAQAAHKQQNENAQSRAKQLCNVTTPSLSSMISIAKLPTGIAAAFNGDVETRVTSSLKATIKLVGLYNKLYRSCLSADNEIMKSLRPKVLLSTLIFNEYLDRQLAFLASDIGPTSEPLTHYPRETKIIEQLRLSLKIFHHGIDGAYPGDLLNQFVEFDSSTILFDEYFTNDFRKILVFILAKQLDYYATRLNQYLSNGIDETVHRTIKKFIALHQTTSGDIRKQAARFIMEYYLRFVFISAKVRSTKVAVSLYDEVFQLCSDDELLPIYDFAYYGYLNQIGIDRDPTREDSEILSVPLAKITDSTLGNINDLLDELSPTICVYLSQIAQKIAKRMIFFDKKHVEATALTGFAVQHFIAEKLDLAFIKNFNEEVSALNTSHHTPLAAMFESSYKGRNVTLDDYFALGIAILDTQNAAQAAVIAERLEQLPEKPFILIAAELATHQESLHAVTRYLHRMLVMLHVARGQALNLPVIRPELDLQKQTIAELLTLQTERGEQPLYVYALKMLILQATRVAQYFGQPEQQVNTLGIDDILTLPRVFQQMSCDEANSVELVTALASFMQPTNSAALCHIMMQKLSEMIREKLSLIHKSLLKRQAFAEQMLLSATMTDEYRARIPNYTPQITRLESVMKTLTPTAPDAEVVPDVTFEEASPVLPPRLILLPGGKMVAELTSLKPEQLVLAKAEPAKIEPPNICEQDLEFELVCQRFQDDDADKCFDGIHRYCHEVLTSKTYSPALRAKAILTLAQALMHQLDKAVNVSKRQATSKSLSVYVSFVMKQDKKSAAFISQLLAQFDKQFEKPEVKENVIETPAAIAKTVTTVITKDIEMLIVETTPPAKPSAANEKEDQIIEKQPRQKTAPVIIEQNVPPVVTERIQFSKLTANQSDMAFEEVCKRCHDENADTCFNNITKDCLDVLQSKRSSSATRVKAALTLARALMHRINEASSFESRDSALKTLQGYQSFISKHKLNATKQFSQWLKDYESRPIQKSIPEQTLPTEAANSPSAREQQADAVKPVPEMIRILKRNESLTTTQSLTTAVAPAKPQVEKSVKTKFYHAHKHIWIDLETADYKTFLNYIKHANAEHTFRNVYQLVTPIIHNAKCALSLRVKLLQFLSQALLERLDEILDLTYHDKTAKIIKAHDAFANKGFADEYQACVDCLNQYKDFLAPASDVEEDKTETVISEATEPQSTTPTVNEAPFETAAVPSTMEASTASLIQRLAVNYAGDNSLLQCAVPPANRLLQVFQMQLSHYQKLVLDAFTALNHPVFIYGRSVLSSLYHATPGHLQFACRLPKDYVLALLMDQKNNRLLCLKEIIESPDKSGLLIRLDETQLQAAKLPYFRSDLLIEVTCLTGINDKIALEQFCHQQRLTSMLFYFYNTRSLIDVAQNAHCTVVYPVMRIDPKDSVTPELDLKLVNPSFPQSTRDNREVIMDALLQLSTHPLYLGCGMALKCFVTLFKHELRDSKQKPFVIEWFDELILNNNAMNTYRWLKHFNMLQDFFPQLHDNYVDDFKVACETADKAVSERNYRCMSRDEIIHHRAIFLLNALYRSFRETITVLDYLQENGLDAFMDTFCRYANGLLFEWMPAANAALPDDHLDLLEVTTMQFWHLLLKDAIPAVYHEFFRCHQEVTYDVADKDKFIQDLMASLAEDGYADRLWLAERVWEHHVQSIQLNVMPVVMH